MHTQEQRKMPTNESSFKASSAAKTNSASNGKSNSAMLSSMGGDDPSRSSVEELGKRLHSRIPTVQQRTQAQIPAAESEADRLSASVTGGSPQAVKAAMGRRMGADFSGVRFHTGADAAAKADSMGARAYTSGADVYFGRGGFDASVAAHELVHTAQQGMVDSGVSTMSTPVGGVQMMKLPSWLKFGSKKKVDLGTFNFNKRAYRDDEDLQKFKGMLDEFNNGEGSAEQEIALMRAASDYIDKNSTGETAKHKGRTSMMEDVLYQLTMRGGTKKKADSNIDRLKSVATPMGSREIPDNYIAHMKTEKEKQAARDDHAAKWDEKYKKGQKTLDGLRKMYHSNGKYSKSLKMISADVMSRQGNTTTYEPGGQSQAKKEYTPDGNGGEKGSYTVQGRVDMGDNDALGTNLHEFTHVASGETYDNSSMFATYQPGTSHDEVTKEMIDRTRRMKELNDLANSDKKVQNVKMSGKTIQNFTKDRYEYGGQSGDSSLYSKTELQYIPNFKSKIAKDYMKAEGADDATLKDSKAVSKKKDELSAMVEERKSGKGNGGELGGNQSLNRILDDYQKTRDVENLANEVRESGQSGNASMDTMIEYDSVINQLLAQFEHAGGDRDSQYYRKLKSAAIRNHVNRRAAALKNNR
ncbi:MAG: DUF4157 domain-containing protein [Oscillospiraceae bacterium]